MVSITRGKERRQSSEAADRRGEVEIQLEEPGMLGGENKQALNPAPGKGSWADPGGFCEIWSKTLTEKKTRNCYSSCF